MKFTPEQELEMNLLKKEVKELLKKYGRTRSMRNLQFDIANIRDEKYQTLENFKVSYGWNSKMKKKVLKTEPRSIVKETAEKELLAWIKNESKTLYLHS